MNHYIKSYRLELDAEKHPFLVIDQVNDFLIIEDSSYYSAKKGRGSGLTFISRST